MITFSLECNLGENVSFLDEHLIVTFLKVKSNAVEFSHLILL